jgi:threonylcarbamoyladenosine tRNA methylthiotransferase MtaB
VKDRRTTVGLITVGCKLNQYETEAMAERLEESGFSVVPFTSSADVYVVNTCTVTARSDYKSRQMLRRAARRNPDALVVATGCYAQREPESLLAMPEVALVIGNDLKPRLTELVSAEMSGDDRRGRTSAPVGRESGSEQAEPPPGQAGSEQSSEFGFFDVTGFRGYTRAFLKIQDGCDRRCAYCAVPDARGPARSRPLGDVLRQARTLGDRGYREIVLTGVHIGAYSDECGTVLSDLVRALTRLDEVDRIRLGSVEPTELTPELSDLILNSPKVCNHLHVPLESGSDSVLRRMGRAYTREHYRDAVRQVTSRDPLCGLGADVMVGFPGETDEDFADTMALIESLPFTYLHVFTYSRRRGTPAASMPGVVPAEEAGRRSAVLRELGKRRSLGFRQGLVGEVVNVLLEGGRGRSRGAVSGLAGNYVRVQVGGGSELVNRIVPVSIRGADETRTWGRIVCPVESGARRGTECA